MDLSFNKSPKKTLFIDLIVTTLSSVILYYFLYVGVISAPLIVGLILTLISIKLLFFVYFNTHKAIGQHSTLFDFANLLKALAASTVSIYIIFIILHQTGFPNEIDFKYPFFDLMFSFLLLSIVRLFYFMNTKPNSTKNNKQRAVIIGANDESIRLLSALINNEKIEVIALVDNDAQFKGKMIHGRRIVSDIYLSTKKEKDNIELVILSDEPSAMNKKILDICFKENIEVMQFPPISNWMEKTPINSFLKKIDITQLLGREEIQLNTDKIDTFISNKTILVTGAAGSIGSELVNQILQFNPKLVILLDQSETGLYEIENSIKKSFPDQKCDVIIADITNQNRIDSIFSAYKPNIVYHAAAYKHVPLMELNPLEAIETNLLGSINLVDASIKHKVSNFVFISTDKAVNPTNVMGATKRATEIYIQNNTKDSDVHFVTTRFGNVLGSNGSVIPIFEKQIQSGGPLTITDERITRYFMTINEACQLVLEASIMGTSNDIFVFDMGESVKIIDLAKKMIFLSGLKLNEDIQIEITGLRPGEKLYEELLTTKERTNQTHHPKIFIGQSTNIDTGFIINAIQNLRDTLNKNEINKSISILKELVPEFKSNNSKFEALDN